MSTGTGLHVLGGCVTVDPTDTTLPTSLCFISDFESPKKGKTFETTVADEIVGTNQSNLTASSEQVRFQRMCSAFGDVSVGVVTATALEVLLGG